MYYGVADLKADYEIEDKLIVVTDGQNVEYVISVDESVYGKNDTKIEAVVDLWNAIAEAANAPTTIASIKAAAANATTAEEIQDVIDAITEYRTKVGDSITKADEKTLNDLEADLELAADKLDAKEAVADEAAKLEEGAEAEAVEAAVEAAEKAIDEATAETIDNVKDAQVAAVKEAVEKANQDLEDANHVTEYRAHIWVASNKGNLQIALYDEDAGEWLDEDAIQALGLKGSDFTFTVNGKVYDEYIVVQYVETTTTEGKNIWWTEDEDGNQPENTGVGYIKLAVSGLIPDDATADYDSETGKQSGTIDFDFDCTSLTITSWSATIEAKG